MNSFLRYDILVLSVREVNLSDGRHVGFVLITLLPSLTEVLQEFCFRKGKILCCFLLKGLFTNLLALLSENRSVTHNKIRKEKEATDGSWAVGIYRFYLVVFKAPEKDVLTRVGISRYCVITL